MKKHFDFRSANQSLHAVLDVDVQFIIDCRVILDDFLVESQKCLHSCQLETSPTTRRITLHQSLFINTHIVKHLADISQSCGLFCNFNLSYFLLDLIFDLPLFVFYSQTSQILYNQAAEDFMLDQLKVKNPGLLFIRTLKD